jgi:hypothetical protein
VGLKEDAGLEVFVLPRTMSFGNWPFLVFLLLIAVVVSASSFIEGDWKAGGLIFGAVAFVPAGIAVLQFLPELMGGRVLVGVYSRGIIWARLWQRGFIPWSNLEGIRQGALLVSLVEHRGVDKPIAIPLSQGTGAPAAFISERLQH